MATCSTMKEVGDKDPGGVAVRGVVMGNKSGVRLSLGYDGRSSTTKSKKDGHEPRSGRTAREHQKTPRRLERNQRSPAFSLRINPSRVSREGDDTTCGTDEPARTRRRAITRPSTASGSGADRGSNPTSVERTGTGESASGETLRRRPPSLAACLVFQRSHCRCNSTNSSTSYSHSRSVICDLLRWCGDEMSRSTQVAPIDIWAQVFACHRAIGQTLDGWAALSRNGSLPSEPLVHRGWRDA